MKSTRKAAVASKKKKTTPAATKGAAPRRAAPPKRVRRSADDLLNRIVVAATEEFARRGFAGTTTATIARRADVTEAQLFRYFGSKSNLFLETVFKPLDQHFLKFLDAHLPELDSAAGLRKQTRLYTSELQQFIREHARLLTSLVMAQTYDSDAAHGLAKIDSLAAYFDRAATMMGARLKGVPETDPKLVVRLAFASVLAAVIFREWIFPEGLASEAAIEAALNSFVIRGVAVPAAKQR